MTISAAAIRADLRPARRFLRTPKGILLVVLLCITLLALPGPGAMDALPGVVGAVAAASVADIAIARLGRGAWVFPSGGVVSGLIVAMVLASEEPWIVPIATAILAVTSKHLFRTRYANVFNPAALALVAASVFWDSPHSWWGAMPDLGWAGVALLLASGLFMATRIHKLPLVLMFLGSYFSMFSAASFAGDAGRVAEIFRTPDLHAVLFFAFFMVDDPPTCPVRYRDQVQFGIIVAVASYLAFQLFGWVYFLPAALLAGNAWEAWRKRSSRLHARLSTA